MTDNFITYRKIEADQSIADFVECFWMAENSSGIEKEVIVMPDASFDLVLSQDQDEPFQICLLDLEHLMIKENGWKYQNVLYQFQTYFG